MTTGTRHSDETHVELNDGETMPRIGFGVFQVAPEETVEAVSHALQTGYRAVDTEARMRTSARWAAPCARAGSAGKRCS
jgi:2,5-diketo-D-gluconate reductase A